MSCFKCSVACSHFELGTLQYSVALLSDSSDDDLPLKQLNPPDRLRYSEVYSDDDDKEMEKPKSVVDRNDIKTGTHILVSLSLGEKALKKNHAAKESYAAICQTNVDENEDVKVCFFKRSGIKKESQIFILNDEDSSFINLQQITEILPTPNIILQGNRLFYKFSNNINVT